MVELHDIEMKETDPANGSNTTNPTTVSKDEKKDADTLTLDGWIFSLMCTFLRQCLFDFE